MKISTHNDWDALKEIIVGRADGARVPTVDASTMSISYAGYTVEEIRPLEGPLPSWVVDESNEDIEELVTVLEKSRVHVHRPAVIDTAADVSSVPKAHNNDTDFGTDNVTSIAFTFRL